MLRAALNVGSKICSLMLHFARRTCIVLGMGTWRVIAGGLDESLTEVVAGRLRGQLAERKIKRKELIELTGWGRATVYRRLSGQTPLDTDELEVLWRLFDISPTFLMTGAAEQIALLDETDDR